MKKTISESVRKNIRQVVYHNELPDGRKHSITRHEPLDERKSAYRRFKSVTGMGQ